MTELQAMNWPGESRPASLLSASMEPRHVLPLSGRVSTALETGDVIDDRAAA
jgi:hypothetical protein